jgi:hypothetical protein
MVRQPMSRARTATISAQPGPQTRFLQSSADIVVFGGAAGCKRYGLSGALSEHFANFIFVGSRDQRAYNDNYCCTT